MCFYVLIFLWKLVCLCLVSCVCWMANPNSWEIWPSGRSCGEISRFEEFWKVLVRYMCRGGVEVAEILRPDLAVRQRPLSFG